MEILPSGGLRTATTWDRGARYTDMETSPVSDDRLPSPSVSSVLGSPLSTATAATTPATSPRGENKELDRGNAIPFGNTATAATFATPQSRDNTVFKLRGEVSSLCKQVAHLESELAAANEENKALKHKLRLAARRMDGLNEKFTQNLTSEWIAAMQARQKAIFARDSLRDDVRRLERQNRDLTRSHKGLVKSSKGQREVLDLLMKDARTTLKSSSSDEQQPNNSLTTLAMSTTSSGHRVCGIEKQTPTRAKEFKRYWTALKGSNNLVERLQLTPRMIILCLLVRHNLLKLQDAFQTNTSDDLNLDSSSDSDSDSDSHARPRKDKAPTYYFRKVQSQAPPNVLDTGLPISLALKLVDTLTDSTTNPLGEITMKVCAICKLPRMNNVRLWHQPFSSGRRSQLESEIQALGVTACCKQTVCNSCLASQLEEGIKRGWWYYLNREDWIQCPFDACGWGFFHLKNAKELAHITQHMGEGDQMMLRIWYERAMALRTKLKEGRTRQGSDLEIEIKEARMMHITMRTWGIMVDPFFNPPHNRLASLTMEMHPVEITVNNQKQVLTLPFFTSFFKWKFTSGSELKECIVCTEEYADIPISSSALKKMKTLYPGAWASLLDPGKARFPSRKLLAECASKHDFDICIDCISHHIDAKLGELGGQGLDRLTCPSLNCGHVLSFNEVKSLASPETFEKYEKLHLAATLSALPNFRWCLREGCGSGQIYDIPPHGDSDRDLANRVACPECHFSMCFEHQVPWHETHTCGQYDAIAHPTDSETQEWIQQNTRACPGPACGVPVEKNHGCFHMTCRSCRYEFCWECGADWFEILRIGRDAHRPECAFRRGDAPHPGRVMGNNLEDAWEQHRRFTQHERFRGGGGQRLGPFRPPVAPPRPPRPMRPLAQFIPAWDPMELQPQNVRDEIARLWNNLPPPHLIPGGNDGHRPPPARGGTPTPGLPRGANRPLN